MIERPASNAPLILTYEGSTTSTPRAIRDFISSIWAIFACPDSVDPSLCCHGAYGVSYLLGACFRSKCAWLDRVLLALGPCQRHLFDQSATAGRGLVGSISGVTCTSGLLAPCSLCEPAQADPPIIALSLSPGSQPDPDSLSG